jgi:glycosyltransferase involved in cell wall biosynthesis
LAQDKICRDKLGIGSLLRFHPPTDVPEVVLNEADALILPSLWEGMPNAVCEALAVGCPVLMSDVSDARFLVEDGVRGYLFDPREPASIAAAIQKFISLPIDKRAAMSVDARLFAERSFNPEIYVSAYETLLWGGQGMI